MANSMHVSRLRNWFLSSPPAEYAIARLKDLLIGALRQGPIPEHVAFIMDGNRRFARARNIETKEGHSMGFEALGNILEICYRCGVKVVTIFAFSTENFKRSKHEVDTLMEMAKMTLKQMAQHGDILDRYGAKIKVLGRLELLKPDVLKAVENAVNMTSHNDKCVLNICCPYTSRDEITTAIRDTVDDYSKPIEPTRPAAMASRSSFSESHITQNIRAQTKTYDSHSDSESSAQEDDASRTDRSIYNSGSSFSSSTTLHLGPVPKSSPPRSADQSPQYNSPETISRQTLADHMLTKGLPPLDILIRTSGVERLSDFMLWQTDENTEIAFLKVMWPEFNMWHFLPVLIGWQRRISKSRQNPDAEGDFAGENMDALLRQAEKSKDI